MAISSVGTLSFDNGFSNDDMASLICSGVVVKHRIRLIHTNRIMRVPK